jgi:hypothetical protein
MRRVLRILLTLSHGALRTRCQFVQSLLRMAADIHGFPRYLAERDLYFQQLLLERPAASSGAGRLHWESEDPLSLAFEVLHHGPQDMAGTIGAWTPSHCVTTCTV